VTLIILDRRHTLQGRDCVTGAVDSPVKENTNKEEKYVFISKNNVILAVFLMMF